MSFRTKLEYVYEALFRGMIVNKIMLRTVFLSLSLTLLSITSLSGQDRIDSLERRLSLATNREKPGLLLTIASENYHRDSISKAYLYVLEAIPAAEEVDSLSIAGSAKSLLGYIYLFWDDYNDAIESFLSSLQIARQVGNLNRETIALHGLSRAYIAAGDIGAAKSTIAEGLSLARKLDNKVYIAGLYNNLATMHNKSGEYLKSLEALKEYARISNEIGDLRSLVYAYNNQGEAYINLEQYEQAFEILFEAQSLNDSINDIQAKAAILGNIGRAYQKLGRIEEAIKYHNQSLEVSLQAGIKRFTADSYQYLSELYEQKKNYKMAFEFKSKAANLKDSLFNEESQRQYNDIVLRYKMADEKQRFELLEEKSENQRLWLFILIFGTILILSLLGFVFISYKLRLRLHSKEKYQMETVIEKQHRELTSALMHSSRLKEVLHLLERYIQEFQNHDPEHEGNIEGHLTVLKEKVKSSLDGLDEWESIKLHFDKVHPNFFKNLQEKYPKLSRYDLKQCAYIKMDLGTKDIARILNISDRAVQTARYRIKKKMRLGRELDLIAYLRTL